MPEDDGLVQNNDPFQGNSPSTSGLTTTNGTQRAATHISSWYIETHNEQLQRPLQSREQPYKTFIP